jgi:hypothetical protein
MRRRIVYRGRMLFRRGEGPQPAVSVATGMGWLFFAGKRRPWSQGRWLCCAVLWERGQREERREQTANDENTNTDLSRFLLFLHALASMRGLVFPRRVEKEGCPSTLLFMRGIMCWSHRRVGMCTLCVVFVFFLCVYTQTAG